MRLSLYFHFPFCLRKCSYCDFNSAPISGPVPDEYVQALLQEMGLHRARLPEPPEAATLYLGGGTPSLMEPEQAAAIVERARTLFHLLPAAEVTLEANPGTVDSAKLTRFRQAGINRLSLGIQSFDDRLLAGLGRIHNGREAMESFTAAREAGFSNVSIDLMHSLPGQTPEAWLQDLEQALRLRPEHISAYGLIVEEGTPFHDLARCGALPLLDEEDALRMFLDTAAVLERAGYDNYEISNFARPGFRSSHNLAYWKRDSYLGFGAGAHSFLSLPRFGRRWRNTPSAAGYLSAARLGEVTAEEVSLLTKEEAMAEFFFLGLRMGEGVSRERFAAEFGMPVEEVYGGQLRRLRSQGLIEIHDGFIRLTRKGLPLANRVMAEFV